MDRNKPDSIQPRSMGIVLAKKTHEQRGPLFLVLSWCIAEEQDYLSLNVFSLNFCGDNEVISF